MELNYKIAVLMLSILFTGLTAGLCFTWSNAVTPGLGRLDDLGFLKAFQAMNRSILNPTFIMVFMSPFLLLFINAFVFKNTNQITFISYLVAAILLFIGVGLVTIFKNVPLNEILDKTVLETASNVELAELRKTFEQPWNRWHLIRSVCSFTSFVLLVIGLLFNK
ncbi:DUF1772 domain-containing protein [Polaribacter litorisediminis]|uniref:anthrone oxygenase family protein n=1 Tax=Polaribacter litorisediminis TaxID=1908341 RepID=UPI001CC07D2C|nr:DUF1772 domain-containing protein [Polaribacter litorisediminis]UAM99053.1 DUF1772 domain-containing protein [Polaribacter litorisediminis]